MSMKTIRLKQNGDSLSFLNSRDKRPIFNPERLSVTYTPLGQEIAKTRIYETSPYESQKEELPILESSGDMYAFSSLDGKIILRVNPMKQGVRLDLSTARRGFGEFGLNLPFNFMGKKSGGGYARQFQFANPYRGKDETYKFIQLDNVDGNHLFLLFLSPADGWKIDYSPYVGGGFFSNNACRYEVAPRFPKTEDFACSWYPWVRDNETFLK